MQQNQDNETGEVSKEEVTGEETPTKEAECRKKKFEGKEAERDPDTEDPRLYSSLQEPDRPAPELRMSGEESDSDSNAEGHDSACKI